MRPATDPRSKPSRNGEDSPLICELICRLESAEHRKAVWYSGRPRRWDRNCSLSRVIQASAPSVSAAEYGMKRRSDLAIGAERRLTPIGEDYGVVELLRLHRGFAASGSALAKLERPSASAGGRDIGLARTAAHVATAESAERAKSSRRQAETAGGVRMYQRQHSDRSSLAL